MFKTRSRTSENIAKRQPLSRFLEIATTGENIPLANEKRSTSWCSLPLANDKYFRQIYDFEVDNDDVYVVSFPKCGTTWIQEATWLLVNNLDFDKANTVDLSQRSVFMEFKALYPNMPRNTVELARNAVAPRVLKSHFPAHLLPRQIWEKRSKIVYCARNPKDAAVSFFHFHLGLGTWQGSIDDFVEDLINNDLMYTPYWQHLMDFWQMRQENNIFFTTYEDMKRDLRKVLIELNCFLGKPKLSEEDLNKLEEHLSFGNMKANPHTNPTANLIAGYGSSSVKSNMKPTYTWAALTPASVSSTTMFETRPRTSASLSKRQRQRIFREVTASGLNIPLANENWLIRWCTLPLEDEMYFKELYEFEVRDDDVFVVTFPKCGTTWIQEATWLLTHNLDFTAAQTTDLQLRSVFMEFEHLYTHLQLNPVEMSKMAVSPRVLKSHFPAHLLPKQIWGRRSKIIYCARNPKDTAVSFFHFHRGLGTWEGDMDEFVEDLINNDIMYSPYWEHLMDFWQMRNEDNVFFTTYEEMKRDLRKVLIELNRFLENPDLNADDLNKLVQHLSFENMKANSRTNPTGSIKLGIPHVRSDFQFMRRGIVGSFKDELSEENECKLNEWIRKNLAKYKVTLKDIFGEF